MPVREILIAGKVVESVDTVAMGRKGEINKSYKRGIYLGCTLDVPVE